MQTQNDFHVKVDQVVDHILARTKREPNKKEPIELNKETEFYWSSLPLCIIDSVFSIQAKYETVVRPLVNRWCNAQVPPWKAERRTKPTGNSGLTVRQFIEVLDERLKTTPYEKLFGNKQRTSSKSGILKAKAVHQFANALVESDINDFEDLHDEKRRDAGRERVTKIPGQKSGLTFKYFLMLAGNEDAVKADTHIRNFVTRALSLKKESTVSQEAATDLINAAANRLKEKFPKLTPARLDNPIWRYESQTMGKK